MVREPEFREVDIVRAREREHERELWCADGNQIEK